MTFATFACFYALVLGLLMIFWPKTMWKMRHWFSVKNGEPSDGYLIMTRISGVILWVGLALYLFKSNGVIGPGGLLW